MRVSESMFFTARFARAAEFAEEKYVFFSADPRGICFAFHGAGRAEKKIMYALVIHKNHSMAIKRSKVYARSVRPSPIMSPYGHSEKKAGFVKDPAFDPR